MKCYNAKMGMYDIEDSAKLIRYRFICFKTNE